MGFKFANQSTEKIELIDGQWVEVRTEVDKETFNRLVDFMPQREVDEDSKLTPGEGVRFQEGLFNALVQGWSAPVPATVENYRKLDATDEVTQSLDKALAEQFQKMTPSAEQGKAPTTSPDAPPKG